MIQMQGVGLTSVLDINYKLLSWYVCADFKDLETKQPNSQLQYIIKRKKKKQNWTSVL